MSGLLHSLQSRGAAFHRQKQCQRFAFSLSRLKSHFAFHHIFTERLCFVSTCRVYHLKPLSCFRKPADGVVELRGWESRRSSKLSNNEAADKVVWTRFLTSLMLNSNPLPIWRYVFILTEALQQSLHCLMAMNQYNIKLIIIITVHHSISAPLPVRQVE